MPEVALSAADLSAVLRSFRREAGDAAAPTLLARFLGVDRLGDYSTIFEDSTGISAELLHARQEGPQRLVFHTSGSTGEPQPHIHEFVALVEEASLFVSAFADRERVVSVMPVHHHYGFVFSLVLPKVLDRPLRLFPPMLTADLLTALRPNDVLVAFPLFWEHVLTTGHPFPEGILGMSATAPLSAAVWDGLLGKGLAGLTEIYGATEAGALGLRRSPRDSFSLLPYWEKETDPAGRCIGFTRRLPSGDTQHLPLPDALFWIGERTFIPTGRVDGAVQVAGVNVLMEDVEQYLRDLPGVKDCRVRLMRPEEGSRLKAFVVPASPARPTARELRRLLRACLPAPAVPRVFTFGPDLPRTATGKATDWSIAGGIPENDYED